MHGVHAALAWRLVIDERFLDNDRLMRLKRTLPQPREVVVFADAPMLIDLHDFPLDHSHHLVVFRKFIGATRMPPIPTIR
jgi:hypothetical protein